MNESTKIEIKDGVTPLSPEAISSIELTRNYKGQYGYKIKVYGNELTESLDKISFCDDHLVKHYVNKEVDTDGSE